MCKNIKSVQYVGLLHDYCIIFFLFQTPIIMTASNDLNSSVMISSVKEFHNPNRRGATMKMNTDGVNFVSYTVLYILYIGKFWRDKTLAN